MLKKILGLIPFALTTYRIDCEDTTGLSFSVNVKDLSEDSAREFVRSKDWSPRRITKLDRFFYVRKILKGDFAHLRGVNNRYLVSFYKQLGAMYKNHVPLVESLTICADSTESKFFKSVIYDIIEDIERGNDLASSLAKYPKVFNRVACTTIRSADTGGFLAEALEEQSQSAGLTNEVNRKLNGAMIYPSIISMLCLGAVLFFAYKVLPSFKPLYETSSIELPMPTTVLLALGDFLEVYPWTIPLFLMIPVYVFIKKQQIFTQPLFQTLFIKFPLTKKVAIPLFMGRFARMVSQLSSADIPYNVQAAMLRESSSVPAYQKLWTDVKLDLERGASFSIALEKASEGKIPAFVTGNLRAGEKAGDIGQMSAFVAEYYEEEVRERIKNINGLIEPVLIVVLGGVVAFLLLAMFLPIFDLSQTIQ